MRTAPKVSVIIPVYNTERYLRECLDSVVNQTLRDIEIICVDDGSTDESPEILREYQAKDERITILREEHSNSGAARNLGMYAATGEYLSFLDSDDFVELTMLEHMYACAKNRNADIVICNVKIYDEASGKTVSLDGHIRKELLPSDTVFSFSDIKRNAFRCIVTYVWNKLIKQDIVIENQLRFQSLSVYEDTVFCNEAMMSAEKITVLDEYLVYYRRRAANDSAMDTRYRHGDCVYSVLTGLREYLMSKGVYARYKRDFVCCAVHLMEHTYDAAKVDPVVQNSLREKIGKWLDMFEITGHDPEYYYEVSIYQRLLQALHTQSADAEWTRLQKRLRSPFICRGVRYIKANGLGYTLGRVGKKIIGR